MLADDALTQRAEINVTPLVDVVLVLLIIFLVIAPLLQHGYDVTIPRTHGGDQNGLQIVVSVGPQGVLYLNRELVTRADLASRSDGVIARSAIGDGILLRRRRSQLRRGCLRNGSHSQSRRSANWDRPHAAGGQTVS